MTVTTESFESARGERINVGDVVAVYRGRSDHRHGKGGRTVFARVRRIGPVVVTCRGIDNVETIRVRKDDDNIALCRRTTEVPG